MMTTLQNEQLIRNALSVQKNAYAPYSNYAVGAALLTSEGQIVTGCNIENGSYGLTVCAERTAVFKAVSEGKQKFAAIAIVTPDGAYPCGACRQVLVEFNPQLIILIANPQGELISTVTLDKLLPNAFAKEGLKKIN